MSFLEGFNTAQKMAVEHQNGPLLIIAGAGTGKTRVISHRIGNLINSGILPEKILAITFTNKAAGEMRERVFSLLEKTTGYEKRSEKLNYKFKPPLSFHNAPFIGTFHSLGVLILRENHQTLNIPKYFSIFDRDDSISTIKRIIKDMGLDPKQHAPSTFLSIISKNKNEDCSLSEFREKAKTPIEKLAIPVWERYSEFLVQEKAFDFDDLLVETLSLLRKNREVMNSYQERWSHIHVDEYQDTNTVQYELTRMLAQKHSNICVVGDHDQCIYTWRSADIRNIARFEKDFPGTTVVTLEENYRSTNTILTAANRAISRNEIRKEKNLFTSRKDGESLEVYTAATETDEAQWVASRCEELISSGTPADDIAVLIRANFQSRALEEAFLGTRVPYQVLGTRFFERKEVKDVLAYIIAALNPDNTTALSRIVNVPARGIGKTTLIKILSGQEYSLPVKTREKVELFRALLKRISKYARAHKPSEIVRFVIQESGLEKDLANGGTDDLDRLDNMRELATIALRYDALAEDEALNAFLENSLLASDQDALKNNDETVKLMTIHAAKGLEFDHVFITGLEEGLFPDERSSLRETPEEREEERRLFYVALTRAKQRAHLTHALVRTIFGTPSVNAPSQFLTEIDEDLITNVSPTGEWTSKEEGRGLLDIEF